VFDLAQGQSTFNPDLVVVQVQADDNRVLTPNPANLSITVGTLTPTPAGLFNLAVGSYTVRVQYTRGIGAPLVYTFEIAVIQSQIAGISVVQGTGTRTFNHGDTFNSDGLNVSIQMTNGESAVITDSALFDVDSSRFNSLIPGQQRIIVRVGELIAEYFVTVMPQTATTRPVRLIIRDAHLIPEHFLRQQLDYSAIRVFVLFNDRPEIEISHDEIEVDLTTFTPTRPGRHTVTLRAFDMTATFDVFVIGQELANVDLFNLTLRGADGIIFDTITLLAFDTFVLPTITPPTGFDFVGWEIDPTRPLLSAGHQITIINRDIFLTAVFSAIPPNFVFNTQTNPENGTHTITVEQVEDYTLSFVWQRFNQATGNWNTIVGETNASFAATEPGRYMVVITATNSEGITSVTRQEHIVSNANIVFAVTVDGIVQQVQWNGLVTFPTTPSRAGYTFLDAWQIFDGDEWIAFAADTQITKVSQIRGRWQITAPEVVVVAEPYDGGQRLRASIVGGMVDGHTYQIRWARQVGGEWIYVSDWAGIGDNADDWAFIPDQLGIYTAFIRVTNGEAESATSSRNVQASGMANVNTLPGTPDYWLWMTIGLVVLLVLVGAYIAVAILKKKKAKAKAGGGKQKVKKDKGGDDDDGNSDDSNLQSDPYALDESSQNQIGGGTNE
jgi:hypothetical protein